MYAIAPVVFPLMDLRASISSMYATYGHWQIIAQDYIENEFMCNLLTPAADALFGMVDPLAYVARLSLPILMVAGSDDEFFHPDIAVAWFGDDSTRPAVRFPAPDDVHFATIANADHPLGTVGSAEALDAIVAFARMLANQVRSAAGAPGLSYRRPVFEWTTDRERGTVRAVVDRTRQPELPDAVYQHYALSVGADNATGSAPRRDFRWYGVCPGAPDTLPTSVCQQQVWWFTRAIEPAVLNATTAVYETAPIADGALWAPHGGGGAGAEGGYRATYVDMHFASPDNYAGHLLFKFRKTTTVLVLPDVFPGTRAPTEEMLCSRTFV